MGSRGASSDTKASGSDIYQYKTGSYKSYLEKMYKYSGATTDENGDLQGGNKTFTGKVYTNDEFMEHLEDGNYHSMFNGILENKLSSAQVTYLKNNMKLGLWSFGDYKNINRDDFKTNAQYTKAVIEDAKKNGSKITKKKTSKRK